MPGSLPTTAQVANDAGLLALENALKGCVGDQFAARAAQNNAACTSAIDAIAPTTTAEQAGDAIRSAMEDWQKGRAIDADIAQLPHDSPVRDVLVGVRSQVDDALKAGPMQSMADTTFQSLSAPLRPYTPEYGPRVATALERGPYQGPYRQPSETIPPAFMNRGTTGIDETLGATGVTNQPVRQAAAGRMIDDFKNAIRTSTDDVLGNKTLSAAAADRWWQANKDVAGKVMTPDQVRGIQTIVDDFAMGARRPPAVAGSNTAQNFASGNILNMVLRFPALPDSSLAQATLGRTLQLLYKIPEERLQETLLNAMMDPKTASAPMVKASEGNVRLLAPMLEQSLLGSSAGAARAGEPILQRPEARATRRIE